MKAKGLLATLTLGLSLTLVMLGYLGARSLTAKAASNAGHDEVLMGNIYLPLVVKNFPFTPDAPVLDAINNNDGDGNYIVSWSPSEGATTYTLQENDGGDFSNPATVYFGPHTSTTIRGVKVGTYTYRVKASNSYASSDWSNVEAVAVTVPPQEKSWVITTIPDQADQGEYSSIALDPDEKPHINFMDKTNNAVKYVHWDGNTWETTTIDTVDIYKYPSTSMALSGNGYPRIAYERNNPVEMFLVEWDGSQWQTTQFTRTAPSAVNLVLKDNGEPCLSFLITSYDPLPQYLIKYACRTTGDWPSVSSTAASVAFTVNEYYMARFHALELDSQDDPHISYSSCCSSGPYDYYLGYVNRVNGSWDVPTVVDNSADVGFYSSLELDSQDHPHISYYDETNGDLKYAFWDGSQWQIENVDSTGNVGSFTSLVLDGGGNAHISYYDETNGDLKYAFWDGSQWQIETVDSLGDVGKWSSLALDAVGNVHISYYDETNGDLKYANNSGAFGQ